MPAVVPITPDVALRRPDLEVLRREFEAMASMVDEASSDAELIDRMQALVALRNSVDAAIVTTEFSFARVHTERMLAAGQTEFEQIERSIAGQRIWTASNAPSWTVGSTTRTSPISASGSSGTWSPDSPATPPCTRRSTTPR